MIDKRIGPLAGHIEPCEKMGTMNQIINGNDDIGSLSASGFNASAFATAILKPAKNPRLRVV